MKRPLSYVTIVTETKSFCAMNQNRRGRSFLSPGTLNPAAGPNNKQRPANPTTFPYAAKGFRLRSTIDSAMLRGNEPVTTARQTARKAVGRKCLAEYLSKLQYQ